MRKKPLHKFLCSAVTIFSVFSLNAHAEFGPERLQSISTGAISTANAPSYGCSISGDGRFLAFESFATNLVPSLTPITKQIYLRDRKFNSTKAVSLSSVSIGAPGDADSSNAALSTDGAFVTFDSLASNLTSDTNIYVTNVFKRDIGAGVTTLISRSGDGGHTSVDAVAGDISSDGSAYTYSTASKNILINLADSDYFQDVFHSVPGTSSVSLASANSGNTFSNGDSNVGRPAISGNGQFVVFASNASNIVSGDSNSVSDVFIRDISNNSTSLVSVLTDGTKFSSGSRTLGPGSVSSDGRFVLFVNEASGDQLFLRDRTNQTTELISHNTNGGYGDAPTSQAKMSNDGRFIIFKTSASDIPSSTINGGIILLDRTTNTYSFLSPRGNSPCISNNGQVVAYEKYDKTTNATQVFVREQDSCLADANKESPGACGCGIAEVDRNTNNVIDCLESWYKPKRPTVRVSGKSASVTLQKYSRARYKVTLTVNKKRTVKTYTVNSFKLINLARGTYTVTYQIIDRSKGFDIPGALSPAARFTIK